MLVRTDRDAGPGARTLVPYVVAGVPDDPAPAVTIRRYQIRDRPVVAAMSEALSAGSLYQRFFTGCARLPTAFLDRLDRGSDDGSIGMIAVLDAAVVGVGELIVTGPLNARAELGLLVRDSHHRRGIGLRLTDSLIEHARARGIAVVTAEVLTQNRAVRSLVRARYPAASATMTGSTVHYELRLEHPG